MDFRLHSLRIITGLPLGLLGCPDSEEGGGDEINDIGGTSTEGMTDDGMTEVGESSSSSDSSSSDSESSDSTDASSSETNDTTDGTTQTDSDSTDGTTQTDSDSTDGTTQTDSDSTDGSETGDTGNFDCIPVEPPVPPADCAAANILLAPEFADDYECFDLGNLPNVPINWGGLTVKIDDPYTLLIGGSANTQAGKLYEVQITRDANCHVTGWAGVPIVEFAEAAFNDGGVTYGPADVLFLARWPNNELGQQELGSLVTDKIIPLGPLGIVSSPGGLNFVPSGFGGEGQLKLVSWPGGQWYSIALVDDGMGTFSIMSATYEVTIQGGPEGFVHISDQNPGFPVDGLLVSEWSAGFLAAYDADANGDPVVNTRRDFVTGLTGAEGAFLDPLSGDFLFTTFGGGNRLIAIRGFMPNPQ
jgi:hypothetical protein